MRTDSLAWLMNKDIMRTVLILGGYGNFGKRIAAALAAKGVDFVIAGRTAEKAKALADALGKHAGFATFDVNSDLADQLVRLKPAVVVNTCGPFQEADYGVAETCIEAGVNYVDLADGRDFVTGITVLDERAKASGVAVVSGASTVPGLSSAVLEHQASLFSRIDRLSFGISPGQRAERGLATTRGIMSYVGKPLKPFPGFRQPAFGWQDLYRQHYPVLGKRWMANCDIPDLDLLPPRYGISQIRFSAGLELSLLHLGLWGLSWLVRAGLPLNLPGLAGRLLTMSDWFNGLGSGDGGMHMVMEGVDRNGERAVRKWFIVARDGTGPHIPTIPAVLLAERQARGDRLVPGAYPCLGLVKLEDYLAELKPLGIETFEA